MPRFNPDAPVIGGAVIRITVVTTSFHGQSFTDHDYMAAAGLTISPGELLAVALAFEVQCMVGYMACLTPDTTLVGTRAADISTGQNPTVLATDLAASPGTATGHALPSETAATIAKTSNLKGQHGLGRFSMPDVPIAFTTPASTPNVLNTAGVNAYLALTVPLLLAIVSGARSWLPVISTRPVSPATLVSRAELVTGFLVRDVLGSARRRKSGRGI